MTAKKLLLFSVLLLCQCICAQQSAIVLDEVVISDIQLRNFSSTQSVLTLNDSTIVQNRPSLTSLLNYNTPIYFKENGYGMVSSPSFRGTTAQHTAVIWNGININSQFNGQTDFNTIATAPFDQIAVRAGGGSVLYGSSAIGGTVHLNNDLSFTNHFDTDLTLSYGSFNTQQISAKVAAGNKRWSFQTSLGRNSSDNDFEWPNGLRNSNGQFENISVSANAAFRINRNNSLKIYSQLIEGERHFSLLSPSDTKTKYEDFNTRNLLEWEFRHIDIISKLKLAHLNEQYNYFGNIAHENYDDGHAESLIAKYDIAYSFKKHQINAVIDYVYTAGSGSDIEDRSRSVGSVSLLFKNNDEHNLRYELGVRQELTNNYESPLLFSLGASYKVSELYTLRSNLSRNFRIPTFNDLYWSEGGNTDLKPESSYQIEMGNEFRIPAANISITAYYMKIENMIQWLPGQTTLWHPRNVHQVQSYGVEAQGRAQKNIGPNRFTLTATYAYTVSENEARKQLIYVPFHKATGNLAYQLRKFSTNVQMMYNGAVFFRTDNNPRYVIDAYEVVNVGAGYRIGNLKLGGNIFNAFGKEYMVMDRRPFPGRNYNIYLNLNF